MKKVGNKDWGKNEKNNEEEDTKEKDESQFTGENDGNSYGL